MTMNAGTQQDRLWLAGTRPFVRTSILLPLCHALDQAGADTAAFLRRHRIDPAALADLYATFPLRGYVAAMEDASDVLADPLFGARLGESTGPDVLGPIGVVFKGSGTLGAALDKLTKYLAVWQGGTEAVVVNGFAPEVSYALSDPTIWPRQQDAEFSLAALCNIIRSHCKEEWRPRLVRFEHERSTRHADRLRAVFGCSVQFGRETNAICLAPGDLDRELRRTRDISAPYVERHLRELLHSLPKARTLADVVQEVIRANLGLNDITIAQVAGAVGLSERTLQRRLSASGMCLRTLLKIERQEAAARVLRQGWRMDKAASRLGYSDAAVLSRAYRGWTGRSPRDFRRSSC